MNNFSTALSIKAAFSAAVITALLLLVPLIAMQFTSQVDWNRADFIVAGFLLFVSVMTYNVVASKAGDVAYRAASGIAISASLLLIWMNLAVGLIGSEDNPANLMYLGELFVGIVIAIRARFKPLGMAVAAIATAGMQSLIMLLALIFVLDDASSGSVEILLVNSFYIALYSASGWLYWRAAQ